NQTEFRFPQAADHDPLTTANPVSMRQILNHDIDREEVLRSIVSHLKICACMADFTRMRYNALLYRRDGQQHRFRDGEGDFQAEVLEVDELGKLLLKKDDGQVVSYGFKEVAFSRSEERGRRSEE
ncbi:MAG: hypothetical protein IKT22_05740, partial [Prevotella sp.]|nr:hypothetical protein [Prevotella sp.]